MAGTFEEQWDECKSALRAQLDPEDAVAWLPGLELIDLSPDKAVLAGIPNVFLKKRLLRLFQPMIRDAIAAYFDDFDPAPHFHLEIELDKSARAIRETAWGRGVSPGTSPLSEEEAGDSDESWPSEQTLASFKRGPENKVAWELAGKVAETPGQTYNPFLVVGGVGMGKTHLLFGIAHAVVAKFPGTVVIYCTGEEFANEVLDGIRLKQMKDVRERFRNADVLLVDDVAFLEVSAKSQEELLHTFEALHRLGKQVVIGSDRMPKALTGLRPALQSRLEMGLIAEILPPERATRLAILEGIAQRNGTEISAEVENLLADRITSSPRRLEGAMVQLAAYSSMMEQSITKTFAETHAAPFFDLEPASFRAPPSAIVRAVCGEFEVTEKRLRSRERSALVNSARRVAMLLLRELATMSYPDIGSELGSRSHSTVIDGIRSVERELKEDASLQLRVNTLREVLQAESQLGRPKPK